MLYIGTHQSAAKGFLQMGKDALSIGANTFQCFLRNPRGAGAKQLDETDITALNAFLAEHSFGKIVAHAPYTLNACSTSADVRRLAHKMLAEDLARMEYLPGNYYNFHPGSHMKQDLELCTNLIAGMLDQVLPGCKSTTVLLETMTGKGTEIGKSFEELDTILQKTQHSNKLGICFDSCHLSDAGYDIIHNLDRTLEQFDKIIGLRHLRAFHINDSMNLPGSRKDRHAPIGDGEIGFDAIVRIITHPALQGIPFITETPLDLGGHAAEIAKLKKAYQETQKSR